MSPEQHLDLDALADVLAGDAPLGAPEHLAGCAECRATLDELRDGAVAVSAELAALPKVTLPADVAARLDDAIRATAATTTATDAADADAVHTAGIDDGDSDGPVTATTTVTPFPTASSPADMQSRSARWLAAAAAVVVLLAGGLYGLSQLRDDSGNGDSAASSAAGGTAPELAAARNNSGADYTDRASLASAVPDLLAGRRQGESSAMVAQAPPQNGTAPRDTASTKAFAVPDPLATLREPNGLAECLLALLPPDDPSVQPLAIDYASFRGKPAMVVVLPGAVANKLDIFVVGPTCSRANDSVVFYTSVDKP